MGRDPDEDGRPEDVQWGRTLCYDLAIAEWHMEKFLKYPLENHKEALPVEGPESDSDLEDAELADEGAQGDSENQEAAADGIEAGMHDAEDPLPDHRIEVSPAVARSAARSHRNLKHPSKLQLARAPRH